MKRFQFGIKHLLIFMCVCAIALSYVAIRLRRHERYAVIIDRLEHARPCVKWENSRPVELYLNNALDNLSLTHEDFEAIAELDSLQTLTIMFAPTLSEKDFAELRALRNLRWIRLISTPLTDTALRELKDLPNLGGLHVQGTAISDAGIETMKAMPHLAVVDLTGTDISDKGLDELATITSLRQVLLGPPGEGRLSTDGIQKFRDMRPDVDVMVQQGYHEAYGFTRTHTTVELLRVDAPCCPSRITCKIPFTQDAHAKRSPLPSQLAVKRILDGISPSLPPHAVKYFLDHAELSPDVANGISPQLQHSLEGISKL